MSSNAVLAQASPLDALQRWLPKLVLAPSMVIVLVGFYGYIGWTFLLSFTNSRFMPSYNFVGLQQYARLWDNDRWWVASQNLLLFGGLFIAISLVIGVFLAVFAVTRTVSLGSIAGSIAFPVAYVGLGLWLSWPVFGRQLPLLVFAIALSGLIIYKHRKNIARLLAGTEHSFKKEPTA